MSLFVLPRQVPITSGGAPVSGAHAYFYAVGTLTPQPVYQDFLLTNPHPLPVVSDANGVFPAIYLNPGAAGNYRLQLKTILDVLIYDQDDIPKSAVGVGDVTDASLNSSSVIYAIDQTFKLTAAETAAVVTPTNYGYAPGVIDRYGNNTVPGTTDMTTAVAAACAQSVLAGGAPVYGASTYLTTATIPSFHAAVKTGPGLVKRGSVTFAFVPLSTQTNNVYVSTTGNDTNDGLGTSQSLLTLQKAFDTMASYGPVLGGTWVVNLAAGTYTEGGQIAPGLGSLNRIQVLGPTGARPFTPTAIIDGTTAVKTFAIYAPRNNMVYVQDVYAKNFASGGLRFGFICEEFADLYLVNCWILNCDIGVKAQQSRFYMDGGDVSGGVTGATMISGTTFTFGYNDSIAGTGHGANVGPYFHGQSNSGLLLQENSTGHADYTTIDTTPVCIDIVEKSRANCVSSSFTHNSTTNIRLRGGSSWANNSTTLAGAAPLYQLYSSSLEINRDGTFMSRLWQTAQNSGFASNPLTGTTAPTTFVTLTNVVDAQMLANNSQRWGIRIGGNLAGTAGAKTISVQLQGNSGASPAPTNVCSLVTNATWVGDFVAEVEVMSTGTTSQATEAYLHVDNSGATASRIQTSGAAINIGTQTLSALVIGTLANAGDTMTIRWIKPFQIG